MDRRRSMIFSWFVRVEVGPKVAAFFRIGQEGGVGGRPPAIATANGPPAVSACLPRVNFPTPGHGGENRGRRFLQIFEEQTLARSRPALTPGACALKLCGPKTKFRQDCVDTGKSSTNCREKKKENAGRGVRGLLRQGVGSLLSASKKIGESQSFRPVEGPPSRRVGSRRRVPPKEFRRPRRLSKCRRKKKDGAGQTLFDLGSWAGFSTGPMPVLAEHGFLLI